MGDASMDRRSFLSCSGVALAAWVTGCLSALDSDGDSRGTEGLPVRFWLEEVSLSASAREAVNPIVFEGLSTEDQKIAQTAIEDGEYTVEQGAESPALAEL